jgi:DNA-binding PadR family transcriptional regulator
MVRSSWAPSATGPARRVYRLTARGMDYIDATVPALEHATQVITRYLRTYAAHTGRPARATTHRDSPAVSSLAERTAR